MSTFFQASRRRRMITWPAWLLFAGMAVSLQHWAAAHDLFAAYIQHSVLLTVGARYCDVEVDLTFFEESSARERAAMDTDANRRITRSEVESYVKKRAPEFAEQVKLRIAGHAVTLVPLYDPEVDLLGNNRVGPAHHRLRLFFFVPTPTWLRADAEVVVEDRLWPAARALGTLQAEGRDGCSLEIGKTSDPGFPPTHPGEPRLFKARCVRPPVAKPNEPVTSLANPKPTASRPLEPLTSLPSSYNPSSP